MLSSGDTEGNSFSSGYLTAPQRVIDRDLSITLCGVNKQFITKCHVSLERPRRGRDAEGEVRAPSAFHSCRLKFVGNEINMPLKHWSISDVWDVGTCSASLYLP